MAVNSFNPRLYSSSSSENDLLEDMRHKAGTEGSTALKTHSISDPSYANFHDKREDKGKGAPRASALSDSSNALKRNNFNGNVGPSPFSKSDSELKTECSTIFETDELDHSLPSAQKLQNNENLRSKSTGKTERRSTEFPEPEIMRRKAIKESDSVFEEDEAPEDAVFFGNDVSNLGVGNGNGIDSFFMRDTILLDATGARDQDVAEGETVQGVGEVGGEDDSAYPEIEQHHYSLGYQMHFEYENHGFQNHEVPRYGYRAEDCGFPELPDDLLRKDEAAIFQKIGNNFFDLPLSPVELPEQLVPPSCTV